MSVITNKDKINENNDRINSLIALVKQKALTSNPKFATTEDEMNAMLTDKHVGKVVKYLGEGGGVAVGTPIAVGDTIDKLYFNTSVEPDLSAITYEEGLAALVDGNREGILLAIDVNAVGASGGYALVSMQPTWMDVLYASEAMEANADLEIPAASKGWNDALIIDGAYTVNSNAGDVATVNRQDLWGSYISKEPFAAGGKYEKNALYIIAEGESEVIENPTAVGDEVTQIYFDTSKSAEEIYADLQKLTYEDMGDGLFVVLAFMGAMETGKYVVIAKIEIPEQDNKVIYMIGNGGVEPDIFAYSPDMTPAEADMGVTEWGWQATSPVASLETYTIAQVNGKEIWGSFLSSSDKFASAGDPAAPRARRLNITEGSLAINENGKFDVSNMESVEVNIAGGLLSAASEDEMTALLVEDNLGQVVKYVGEAGELIGVPPAVGDTIETLYFNTSVTPDFEAIKASSTIIKGADIHGDWANAYFTHYVTGEVPAGTAENYFGFFDMSEMQEGLFIIADDQMTNMVYISQDVSADITGGEAIKGGWQMDSVEASALWPRNDSTPTWVVQQIGGQDLWSTFISKEPFAAGGKYEKDALYLIAEATNAPIKVGDTVDTIYFNTSVEPDFDKVKADSSVIKGSEIHGDFYNLYMVLSFSTETGEGGGYLAFADMNDMMEGLWAIMPVNGGDGPVYLSKEVPSEITGGDAMPAGWITDHVDTTQNFDGENFSIKHVGGQEVWGVYISKEPFTSGGGVVAKKLTTQGSSPSGGGDGSSLTVTTEEELNALDTAENVGKIVSYNDGLYIITED